MNGASAVRSLQSSLRAVAVVCAVLRASAAAENWMFATPEPLPEPINLPRTTSITPWLSADGLTLYFSSDRPGGFGLTDLWLAERNSTNDNWKTPVNVGPQVNTSAPEAMPFVTPDGLTLYFGDANALGWAPRAGGPGNYQIWTTTRADKNSPWSIPSDLKAPIGSSSSEQYPHLSADGLALYFTRKPGYDGLAVARRASIMDPWLPPAKLPSVITQGYTGFPYLSSSGLHLFFYSNRGGGRGSFDLWMATRTSLTDEWTGSANLGPQVNTANIEMSPCISAEFPALGSYLLFARNDTTTFNGNFKLYKSTVIPNITVQSSPQPEGPWSAVATATFTSRLANTYQSELTASPSTSATFYRLALNATTGVARFTSAEKLPAKIILQYRIE